MLQRLLLFLTIIVILPVMHSAQSSKNKTWPEQAWGIGMSMRVASMPFSSEEKAVGTVVPMFWYRGEKWYMRGMEGGYRFFDAHNWRFALIGRMHFFDAPKEYQNQLQGDNIDWGFQAHYNFYGPYYFDIEIMTDVVVNEGVWRANPSNNIRFGYEAESERISFNSFFEFKIKSENYNSYYFGLNQVKVKSGTDMSIGAIAYFHIISNLHVFGAAKLTLLDRNARNVNIVGDETTVSVNSDLHGQVFAGIGFSNDPTTRPKKKLRNTAYVRVGQGFATPSTLAQILHFESSPDTNNNKLTSIFYGQPLTDELFGLPLEIYMTPGFTFHWPSDVQTGSFELGLAVKLYYTIKWPIRWRLGAAEGLSWVNKVPYMEANSLAEKDYKPSNLMNFLDFSIDFNIGDIFGNEPLQHWWLGYYIHHRSSIFETAQQFGRISGGSNYHTIYLQWNW